MTILDMLSGPLIGGLIGYFTNYIAVKMLFRPLYPKKIGRYTLPFSPGLIPKRQGELARAIGNAVGNELLTKADIEQVLLSENMKKAITDAILEQLKKLAENESSVKGNA